MIWILIIRGTNKIYFQGEKEKQEWSLMTSSNIRMSRNYMKEIAIKYYHKFLNVCIVYMQNSICADVNEPQNLSPSACMHCLKEMLKQEFAV